MITDHCQRFQYRRQTWRPSREVIEPLDYLVEPIPDDTTAKAFVLRHHYDHSYPAARFRFGLYRCATGELVGVAVFSQPWQHVLKAAGIPFDASETVELSRFVLLDEVPANAESWFIGHCFRQLRDRGLAGALSFSDPCPRTAADGGVVFGGHLGIIYQATNGVFTGCSRTRTIRLLPDGQVLSDRVLSKIRAQDKGWHYGVHLLVRYGADVPGRDIRGWLNTWRDRLTRKLRHPGNYRYCWALQRRNRRHLPDGRPYPKVLATIN